jgi:Ca2+-binding RTX toxin-like protein
MSFPGKRLALAGLTAIAAVSLSAIISGGATAGETQEGCRSVSPTTSGLIGTNHHDVIVGTQGDDVIDAKGGNDRVCARNGDDTIMGGDGDDTIRANAGQDFVDGGDGNDSIHGNAGDDGNGFIVCKGNCDKSEQDSGLFGGPGDDFVGGGAGYDFVNGEEDDDVNKGAQDIDYCPDKQCVNTYPGCEGPFLP